MQAKHQKGCLIINLMHLLNVSFFTFSEYCWKDTNSTVLTNKCAKFSREFLKRNNLQSFVKISTCPREFLSQILLWINPSRACMEGLHVFTNCQIYFRSFKICMCVLTRQMHKKPFFSILLQETAKLGSKWNLFRFRYDPSSSRVVIMSKIFPAKGC